MKFYLEHADKEVYKPIIEDFRILEDYILLNNKDSIFHKSIVNNKNSNEPERDEHTVDHVPAEHVGVVQPSFHVAQGALQLRTRMKFAAFSKRKRIKYILLIIIIVDFIPINYYKISLLIFPIFNVDDCVLFTTLWNEISCNVEQLTQLVQASY